MPTATVQRSPLFYARLAGVILLSAMALSIFSQMFVLDRLVVQGDARATAGNIVASEGLFRLGIAVDVIIAASDVVIAWAFYELLKTVDRSLALVGAFLRVTDGAILAITTFSALLTLRLLSGVDYLQAFSDSQLQSPLPTVHKCPRIGVLCGFRVPGLRVGRVRVSAIQIALRTESTRRVGCLLLSC